MQTREVNVRYWFDTEFHEDGHAIELISIGVVAEDGREYYAVSADYDPARATDWLCQHVLPQLGEADKKPRSTIRDELADFFAVGGVPEFWAECGEYDWIVLRQLFGTLTDWPQGWPYLAMDVEQWRLQSGAAAFPPQASGLHNALEDARTTHARWLTLTTLSRGE